MYAARDVVQLACPGAYFALPCLCLPELWDVGCGLRVIGGLLVLVHIDGWVVVGLRACREIER